MKKLISSVCLMFVVSFALLAQNLEDVIYLRNGSIIRGIIVEQIPGETLKIQTRDGNLFVYNIADVQKITKEIFDSKRSNYFRYPSDINVAYSKPIDFNKPKGYFGLVEIGLAPGLNGYEPIRISATVINGYRILPQFAIGIGVGRKDIFTNNY